MKTQGRQTKIIMSYKKYFRKKYDENLSSIVTAGTICCFTQLHPARAVPTLWKYVSGNKSMQRVFSMWRGQNLCICGPISLINWTILTISKNSVGLFLAVLPIEKKENLRWALYRLEYKFKTGCQKVLWGGKC